VTIFAALALLAGAGVSGCSSDAGIPVFVAETPLVWVDPARCLISCTHTMESGLIAVSASARPTADGPFLLRAEAQLALAAMIDAAAGSSITIAIGGAHRTHEQQAMLWDALVATEPGRAARPGHSEHEAGLAVDVSFVPDAGADWAAANAWRFGYVLSYPRYKEKATGFRYESWHFRFVGSAVAATLHESAGLTLEELFHMTPDLGVSGDCADCPMPSSRSDCAAVTTAGACTGTVLTWCFDGASAAVDCASSGLVCGPDATGQGADCVDP
jgi:hypothetical protein